MSKINDVRLLITDTGSPPDRYFSDPEVESFLRMEEQDVRRAAAMALETMARNETLVQKRIRILDLQTDGPAVAKELRESAKGLREQADEEEGGFDYFAYGR